ncbi:MAG: hypothetical protein IT435_19500 [Phycisphaerales bacterium]|nr:hypothetical protein [Phycisphaerales bacterium]
MTIEQLARQLHADFPADSAPEMLFADAAPPVQVIDCVLSLRKKYDRVVVPRVNRFLRAYPEVDSCKKLLDLIHVFRSPLDFMQSVLDLNSPTKAHSLLGVTSWLDRIQHDFAGETETHRLQAWAAAAKPQDHLTVGVKHFAIAGFQYLRMRFGADTVKPDAHILGYIAAVIGRPVSEIEGVTMLEDASKLAGVSARRIDGLIWERQADWKACK